MVKLSRIDVIVASARQRLPFTHFLSIPVNTPSVQENFLSFKKDVLEAEDQVYGLDETIFQTETLLHLTVGTMALMDERERDLAKEILMDSKESIIQPLLQDRTLEFSIEGLEIMNDDPGDVDVMYGKVRDDSGALQSIVDALGKFTALYGINVRAAVLTVFCCSRGVCEKRVDEEGVRQGEASRDAAQHIVQKGPGGSGGQREDGERIIRWPEVAGDVQWTETRPGGAVRGSP